MTYNGWTNWATWNVNLWIDNEEPLYREKQRFLRRNRISLESVKTFVFDVFPTGTPDMDSPAEMSEVDWSDLAESWEAEAAEYQE